MVLELRRRFLEPHNQRLMAEGHVTWYDNDRLFFRVSEKIYEVKLTNVQEILVDVARRDTMQMRQTEPNYIPQGYQVYPRPIYHLMPGGIWLTEAQFQRVLQGAINWLQTGRD